VLSSYNAVFYATRMQHCDIAFSPMVAWPERLQCWETAPDGTDWGDGVVGCPTYSTTESTTTTTSLKEAGCCGQPLTPSYSGVCSLTYEKDCD